MPLIGSMDKKGLFLLLVSVIILSSCQVKTYVCPDGTTASSPTMCPTSIQTNSYCGDKRCDAGETCESCSSDCGLCTLKDSDVSVKLEWKVEGTVENKEYENCGIYNIGTVQGTIKLSDEIKAGLYICKTAFNGEREVTWSLSDRTDSMYSASGFFTMIKPLKRVQNGEICCYSNSPIPDFCKTITLAPYC